MEEPVGSRTGWSSYDHTTTHRCTRYSMETEYCDDPDNKHSWPCHQAACNYCVDLDWNLYQKDYSMNEAAIETMFKNVTVSVERGCKLCSLLCQGVTAVSKSMISEDTTFWEKLEYSRLRINLRKDRSVVATVGYPFNLEVEFYSRPGDQPLSHIFGIAEHVPFQLNTTLLVAFAKRHMDECIKSHAVCTAIKRVAQPRRLIDVGLEITENPRLVLVETEEQTAPYITLSHCWGQNPTMLTTTQDTITQRLRGILFSDLPKTFQEAVQITRALGVRYLWIDSLCIMQDDKEDWERESTKMAGIYMESCLTIAATASSDSTGGFFFNRTSQREDTKFNVETVKMCQNLGGGGDIIVYARPLLSHRQKFETTYHSSDEEAPLLSRAWAYQERMLAPRTLHDSSTSRLKEKIARAVEQRAPIEDTYSVWKDIVEEYSSLALTKESDRLPALSGLASLFLQKLGSLYLAGIWEDDLVSGLLWSRIEDRGVACSREISSNIPSWSWASLVRDQSNRNIRRQHHHIILPDRRLNHVIADYRLKILQSECRVIGSNPLGEVSGGKITIQGALIEAEISYQDVSQLDRPSDLWSTDSWIIFQGQRTLAQLDIAELDGFFEVMDGEKVTCILFCSGLLNQSQGLILKNVGPDTFRRVGTFYLGEKTRWFGGKAPLTIHII
ncbi:hypothetical protein VTL71DRAFT_12116 [Oculimacula yallundae]|uniref:Heterokaryon incompatibility domain-containing protein n=1 Tax=Oculimacula yallundae TaxID=86028 RepID=A0ABR4CTT0_9HELO